VRRVTVVCESLAGGGAERVAADLCRYLVEQGRDVTLLTLMGDDADDYECPEGVRRVRMEIRRAPPSLLHRVWYLFGRVLAVRRKLIVLKPDVVVTFMDKVNMLVLIALFGTGIPVIVSERVHPGHNPIARLWFWARQVIYPLARSVTVQTEEGAEWFRRKSLVKHPIVIPNAVRYRRDLEALSAVVLDEARHPFVLAIGRLDKQKGFDLLLEAFSRSGLPGAGWSLVILGRGGELAALKQQAAALGIANAVTFAGFMEVGPWLAQADLFVLSSRFEDFPNALMEAMQMQRACISFDCLSGPSDLIENEQNGVLVAPQDVAALSEALKRLAADPALRSRLGAEAGKVSERFSHTRIYGKWLALIDAVAAGKAGARLASFFAASVTWQFDHETQGSRAGEG
jgi:glycosyltransferase involved in cell wall biosynthesis